MNPDFNKHSNISPQCTKPMLDPGVDLVNHPPHYTQHPSGVECIQITEHMGFNLGNALKYIWRADLKGTSDQDMKKAIWYIQRELDKREKISRSQSAGTGATTRPTVRNY